jgi:putative oxidoreductase
MSATAPAGTTADDIGKLILRVLVGGMMLFHGVGKLQSGVSMIEDALEAKGLPRFVAYGVYVGEVVAPALLILGLLTRPAAAILAFNMVVAIGLAHAGDIFKITEHGAWAVELQVFYLLSALAIVCLGSGRLSISKGAGRLN